MYGIVNKAIEDLVRENFGDKRWENIKLRSGVDIEYFISNEPYDDAVTYKLAQAVSDEMKMPLREVLIAFGEWWVMRTGKEKYGSLMEAGGKSFREFMVNLPAFHNRVMLIYPKLTPPEFRVTELGDQSIYVHYISKRPGLSDFVRGLLQGIGKIYHTPVVIEEIETREAGHQHDVFKVSW